MQKTENETFAQGLKITLENTSLITCILPRSTGRKAVDIAAINRVPYNAMYREDNH